MSLGPERHKNDKSRRCASIICKTCKTVETVETAKTVETEDTVQTEDLKKYH